ncbi:iron-containing redox enzyme family protein [Kitasatospora sp. NPDC002965]|uniref:iron-containing redox enzyme family protein n=1 Tax=Kitasatospora sp. NPDC002965 TaxID=3154775 RepID=UPI0033ADEEA3
MRNTAVQPEPDHRILYLRALDPEGDLPLRPADLEPVRAALAAAGPEDRRTGQPVREQPAGDQPIDEQADFEELTGLARTWAAEVGERFRKVLAGPDVRPHDGPDVRPTGGPDNGAAVRCVLLNCAPLALSAGAWLQWLSSSGNAETELALRVLTLYAADVGVGYPEADRGSDYSRVLHRHRIEEPIARIRLAANERVEGFSFRLPALLLAMSRQPGAFLPELLGADLCLRSVGLPPPLAGLGPEVLDRDDVLALDLGAARGEPTATALDLSAAAARQYLAENGPAGAERLRRGFHWALGELRRWCDALLDEALISRHPDYEVWRMICTRARQAAVYHSRFKLAGRPLGAWFADVGSGPGPFLDALAASPLVRPGRPDASPLLRGLIGPKGPMFRIFTPAEIAVLRRWIAGLPTDGAPGANGVRAASGAVDGGAVDGGAAGAAATDGDGPGRPDDRRALHRAQRSWYLHQERPAPAPSAPDGAPLPRLDVRAAYRALLARKDTPGLRRYAYDYARRWLARARYGLDRAPQQLPAAWAGENGLREWLDQAHDRHGTEFAENRVPIPSREELIDSTLQLAPLIMIDGGWLQGFTDYRLASSRCGQFLFRTYWDELGNGERELNHPKIYRDLLAAMGVELPPTDSAGFAGWPGLRDDSFALPVYWLSVSRFPQRFQPEILGLNLAMELSGVGGSYRSARAALRHHGFSTQFVDLHNTIDNVATGHSAWAADAIDSYMADLPGVVGPQQESTVWERVRAGYRSLNPPEGTVPDLYAALNVTLKKRN